ncbi:MAG: HNH endonuclease [Deltaproteobacteria bacterium]|nr:HNH endonuclease [Deltaproteobacteria bacterium]
MDPSSRSRDYQPGLCAAELLAQLGGLLAEQRRAERLICRYLADLADSFEARATSAAGLAAYVDVYQLARCRLGLGMRATRERVRVGRALRALPAIEQAWLCGKLSFSRVREVTRIATPDDEILWLRRARELPMRMLEQGVAEAGGAEGPNGQGAEPAQVRWRSPEAVEVRLVLPAETWALVQRAMEGARRGSEASLSDAEALEAVAREALARQAQGSDAAAEPERTVVLYECRQCGQTELETGAGAVELTPQAAARLGCGAQVRDLATEGRAVQRGGPLPAAVRRAVKLRDRCRCRVPGCSRRRYVDVHHIAPQAQGGAHSRANCLTLCSTHHALLHEDRLRIEGDADGELRFYDATGALIGDALAGGAGPMPMTQCGSWAGELSAEGGAVLRAMGGRGGWHVDDVCQATGLPASAVSAVLLELELGGRVRSTAYGHEPVSGLGQQC